jgi:CTP:molybdopterin cytidylyltransferase MocA
MALRGDVGARQLTLEFPVLHIEVDDPGILLDVDLPSDLLSG